MAEMREAWVRMPSREQAGAIMNAALSDGGRHPYDFGFVGGMIRLIMAHPGYAPFFGQLFQRIMFGPGVLSRAEREMVAAVAAAAQDCRY
jgi:hypothetical protein